MKALHYMVMNAAGGGSDGRWTSEKITQGTKSNDVGHHTREKRLRHEAVEQYVGARWPPAHQLGLWNGGR